MIEGIFSCWFHFEIEFTSGFSLDNIVFNCNTSVVQRSCPLDLPILICNGIIINIKELNLIRNCSSSELFDFLIWKGTGSPKVDCSNFKCIVNLTYEIVQIYLGEGCCDRGPNWFSRFLVSELVILNGSSSICGWCFPDWRQGTWSWISNTIKNWCCGYAPSFKFGAWGFSITIHIDFSDFDRVFHLIIQVEIAKRERGGIIADLDSGSLIIVQCLWWIVCVNCTACKIRVWIFLKLNNSCSSFWDITLSLRDPRYHVLIRSSADHRWNNWSKWSWTLQSTSGILFVLK